MKRGFLNRKIISKLTKNIISIKPPIRFAIGLMIK